MRRLQHEEELQKMQEAARHRLQMEALHARVAELESEVDQSARSAAPPPKPEPPERRGGGAQTSRAHQPPRECHAMSSGSQRSAG